MSLTVEQAASAEAHLRFVLNMSEHLLGALVSNIRAASHDDHAQPATAVALAKVAKAMDIAYSVIVEERTQASTALKKRLLKEAP